MLLQSANANDEVARGHHGQELPEPRPQRGWGRDMGCMRVTDQTGAGLLWGCHVRSHVWLGWGPVKVIMSSKQDGLGELVFFSFFFWMILSWCPTVSFSPVGDVCFRDHRPRHAQTSVANWWSKPCLRLFFPLLGDSYVTPNPTEVAVSRTATEKCSLTSHCVCIMDTRWAYSTHYFSLFLFSTLLFLIS